jgi:FtsH-binding integral membrane protein
MILYDVQQQKTKKYVKLASIALMALYIVFDTYNNFEKDYNNDNVISTLDYYTDLVSIYQNILTFFQNEEKMILL